VSEIAAYTEVDKFLTAMRSVADALGADIVAANRLVASDVPLEWDGVVVGGLRIPQLVGALERLIEQVERDLGSPLGELSREGKQLAVRMLEDGGAFTLRRAVDQVADVLGVSRITVYNYLNLVRG
jgi:HTH domain